MKLSSFSAVPFRWISNPDSMSLVLGIQGPPGNGKTTLCRQGIAEALGRPFAQISLGGATDASVLEGHSYTCAAG